MPRITSIEKSPPFTRVHRVVELVAQWWVDSDRGWTTRLRDSGVVPSTQGLRWIVLDAIVVQEWFYLSQDLRDKEEMLDSGEVSKASGENLIVKSIVAKNVNSRHQSFCPSLKSTFESSVYFHSFQECPTVPPDVFYILLGGCPYPEDH